MLELPDTPVVLPGHYSHPGELSPAGWVGARLGDLKVGNEGLRALLAGEQAFTTFILGRLPDFPPQYVEIPIEQLMEKIHELDPAAEVAVICRSGRRSAYACRMLQQSGFKRVWNVVPGMSGWSGSIQWSAVC